MDLPDGTKCNNDGVAPGTVTFKVDASRQEGTMLTTNPYHGVSMGTRTGLLESGHLHVDQNLSRGQKPTPTPTPTPPQSSSGFGHETST